MGKDKKFEFRSYKDASEWLDDNDMADYLDRMTPADISFDLRKNRDLVELDREVAKTVRSLAKKQNIPTRKLVNNLLRECIEGGQ